MPRSFCIVLLLLCLLCCSGVAWAQTTPGGSLSLSGGGATVAPNATVSIPIVLALNSGIAINSLAFGVAVAPSPAGSAPAAGTVSFVSSIGNPSIVDNEQAGKLSVLYYGLTSLLRGTVSLGTCSFTIPATARNGQSYSVSIGDGAQGSLDTTAMYALSAGFPLTFTIAGSTTAAPTSVMYVSGTGQTGAAGTTLSQPFVVKVTDAANGGGNALSDVPVTFTVTGGGGKFGSASSTIAYTDASGLARATLTLGPTAGTNTVTAQVTGVSGLQPVSFTATATGTTPTPTPASITSVSGNAQTGTAGAMLSQPFVVKVTDGANGGGNPLPNISVTFTVITGGGKFGSATSTAVTTDASGQARTTQTLGPAAGANTAKAEVTGMAVIPGVSFTATGTVTTVTPASVTYVSGNGQTATAGTTLSQQFVVKVTDALNGAGTPLANIAVTFQVTGGGGKFNFADSQVISTDSNGLARAMLTLGPAAGVNTATATVANLPPVSFTATATAQNNSSGAVLSVAPGSLTFNAVLGGSSPAAQSLMVFNGGSGALSWGALVAYNALTSPAPWLSLDRTSGTAPSAINVSLKTDVLAGIKPGTVTALIGISSGSTSTTVAVTLNVQAAPAKADLVLSQDNVAVQAIVGSTALQARTVTLASTSAPINWTAAADPQATWLSVSATSGTTPGSLAVQLNPAGLTAGQYAGAITLSAPGGASRVVNVTLNVSAAPQLVVRPSVITFSGAAGGTLASQAIEVRTATGESIPFTASVELPAGRTWLTASPVSGSTPGTLALNAATSGLAAGTYAATLTVTSPNAANRATATVLLQLSAPNLRPTMDVSPAGVLLVAQVGGGIVSQDVTVTGDSGTSFTWTNDTATFSGGMGTWLSATQSTTSGNGVLTIKAMPAGLAAGLYSGQVTLRSSGTVNPAVTINVAFLVVSGAVTPLSAGVPAAAAAGGNVLVVANPAQQVMAKVGFPRKLEAFLVSMDGKAVTPAEVSVSVSGESRPIPLAYQGNGLYAAVWTPLAAGSVLLRFSATGASDVLVPASVVAAGNTMPVLFNGGAVNGASFAGALPISAGSIVSVFGANLSSSTAVAQTVPLPTSLGSAKVTVNGVDAPLFFVSSGQVNLQIPFELAGQTSAAIRYASGDMVSVLADVPLAPVSPGIFVVGGTQGAVIHQDGRLVDASAPAAAGEWLSIYVTGLGEVSNTPASGARNFLDKLSPTSNQPTVTLGGIPAEINFSGLAPGFVALYQINAQVPAAVPAGNAVPVVVRINNVVSNTATIAVK